MKALIKVGYGCNENCTFCHTLEVRHIDGTAAEVHAKIDRAHQLGHTMVVLSGGEPTLRPELYEWAEHIVARGMDLGLVTNGLLLAYPHVLERLLKLRLKYVYMSLHGGSAKVHNAVTRANTFDVAMAALKNLTGRNLDLTINCVIVKQNVDHLKELVEATLPFKDATVKFSMLQPKGGGAQLFDTLTAKVTQVGERVREAIAHGLHLQEQARQREPQVPEPTRREAPSSSPANGERPTANHPATTEERSATNAPTAPRYAHDGLPFCHVQPYEALYDDLKTHRFATMVDIGEPDFFPVDDKAKSHPEPCRGCALRGACPGLYTGYYATHGAEELRPVLDRPRSNAFNYVLESLTAWPQREGCPIREGGVTPWDRGRQLFVRSNGRLARYRTDTRDFADAELERIKHDLGQVYVDVSRKDAPDDFARDLVPLRRSALCTGCPEHARCTGLFEPLLEDLFTRDDQHVREHLRGLRGDVLDLGCGEAPYHEALAENATAGLVRYVGVDPNARLIAQLTQRHPWGRFITGDAESLPRLQLGAFDHVLLLRSWNHLRDPDAVLQTLRGLLRPGGQLLIVDNVAFGLARTPRQTQQAEASPAAFEHYRNDDAEAAQARVIQAGFRLMTRRDVGPETSNQWVLRFETSPRS